MTGLTHVSHSSTSLWVQNLVDGVAGITMKAKHADYFGASPFQKIEVFDTYGFGRVLVLGGTVVLTEKDEHIYSEMITHPPLLSHPAPRRVCIIGGGDGGSLREVLKHACVERATVVEIDVKVKEVVEAYFGELAPGFSDPRARVEIADGRAFLDSTKEVFDAIIVDSYDPGGPVASLETADFHRQVSARLDAKGIAVFQTDSPTVRPDAIRRTLELTAPVFAERVVYFCAIPSFPGGMCSFVLCAKDKGILDKFDEQRYGAIAASCRYYSDHIHRGSRLLPRSVKLATEY